MSRIAAKEMKKWEKDRNYVHDVVEATYSVFVEDGERFFQIDTYGKPGRAIPGKISQSIQFDEQSARQLVALLAKELNLSFHISE